MLFVSLPNFEPVTLPPICWRMSSVLSWDTGKGCLRGLLLRASASMEMVSQVWVQNSAWPLIPGWGTLGQSPPPPHPEQLIVSFISVLSIGPVTVNSITLGPWRVILDQQCVVELPALMEWSLSVSSNIVGHWPLECGYCNRN